MMNQRRKRTIVALGLTAILLIGGSGAQASINDSSRISRLESEIFTLRSQLNRLESEVSQLRRSERSPATISVPDTIAPDTPSTRSPNDPTLAEQFDNLAILAIELKDRINAIEERLSEIEAQIAP